MDVAVEEAPPENCWREDHVFADVVETSALFRLVRDVFTLVRNVVSVSDELVVIIDAPKTCPLPVYHTTVTPKKITRPAMRASERCILVFCFKC